MSAPPTSSWSRPLARAVLVPVTLILGLLMLIGILLGLLVSTSWGTRAVAMVAQKILPPLHIEQAEGALLGRGHIGQLSWTLNPTQTWVADEIDWELHHITLIPWPGLDFEHVHVQRLALRGAAPPTQAASRAPLTLPNSLMLPVGLRIEHTALDILEMPALAEQPLRQLKARVTLIAGPVGTHHIDHVEGGWSHVRWQGQAEMAPTAPFQLKAQASLVTTETAPVAWQAHTTAQGTLNAITLNVDLHGLTQTLQGTADIRPLAAWPMPSLNLHTDQLNLAALHPSAPQTSLSGDVRTRWQSDPMRWDIEADLHNAKPGSLDQHGLPVRHLRCRMHAQHLQGITRGEIESFTADMSGRIEGRGQWTLDEQHTPQRLSGQLLTQLTQWHPAEIDRRGPAFEITGPVTIEARLPWPLADIIPIAQTHMPWGSPWGSANDHGVSGVSGVSDLFVNVRTDLRGQEIDRSDLPSVQLQLNGSLTPQRLHIEQLTAYAGSTHLHAQGVWERAHLPHPSQHLALEANFEHFDPRVWWPGENAQAWRHHPTQLDGTIKADLHRSSSPAAPTPPLRELNTEINTLRGEASLQLGDSLLAGLPLSGTLHLQTQNQTQTHPPPPHGGGERAAPPERGSSLAAWARTKPHGHQRAWHLARRPA